MINTVPMRKISQSIIQNKSLEKQFFIICKNKQYQHIIPDQLIKENLSIQNNNKPFISYNIQLIIEYSVFSIDQQQEIFTKNEVFLWNNEILYLMIRTMRIDEEATFYVSSFLSRMLTNYKITNIPLKVKIKVRTEEKIIFSKPNIIIYLQNTNFSQEYRQQVISDALDSAQKYLKYDKFNDAIIAYQFILNILYDNPPWFHDKLVEYLYLQTEINMYELPCTFQLLNYQNNKNQIKNNHQQRIKIRIQLIETLINAQKHRRACYQILCAVCEIMCFQNDQRQDNSLEKCIEYLLIIDQNVIKILNPKVLIIELAQATNTIKQINELIQRNKELQKDEMYLLQLKYKHYLEKINVEQLSQLTYNDMLVISDEDIQKELNKKRYTTIKNALDDNASYQTIENKIIKSQQFLDDAIEHYNFGNIKAAIISSYIGLLMLLLNQTGIDNYVFCFENVLKIDPLSNEIEIEQKKTFVQIRTKLFRRVTMCYQYLDDDKNTLIFNDLCIQSQLKDNILNPPLIKKCLDITFDIYQKLNDYDNLRLLAQNYLKNTDFKYDEEVYKIFKEFLNKVEMFYTKFNKEKQALINAKYKNMFSSKK